MFFTITNDTNNVTVHATRKAARKSGEPVFSTPEQLAELISDSKRLVAIWNMLPGSTPVTKFTNRKIGIERVWKALQGFAATIPQVEQEPANTVVDVRAQAPDVASEEAPATKETTRAKKEPKAAKAPRETSKTETVLALMRREGGVTLKEIMAVTSWQSHSVRGFISGTLGKRMGITVVSTKGANGERSYSIKK